MVGAVFYMLVQSRPKNSEKQVRPPLQFCNVGADDQEVWRVKCNTHFWKPVVSDYKCSFVDDVDIATLNTDDFLSWDTNKEL